MTIPRYSKISFPKYAHRPGQTVHPEKPGGHMYQQDMLEPHKLTADGYHDNDMYLFSIDLYNHGFYWEAHVYLEELWHLDGRQGMLSDFLKLMIALSAVKLLSIRGETAGIERHERRIERLLKSHNYPKMYLGINLHDIKKKETFLKLTK